jgi:ArsR family transcriptional regulator, arsenate/arsenite/antimonite-responsive transcriptional repressor
MRELEQVFKGLADQNRLRILNLLLHGELCVCDIQCVLASSQPNVSRHLTYLKNAGLVQDRREGTRIYYRLAGVTEGVHRPLFAFLREAFRKSEGSQDDIRKLKKAIQTGSCTVSEWRPFFALTAPGAATPHR